MLEHPVDAALQALPSDAPPVERLEIVWQAYEAATGAQIERPPTADERSATLAWLREGRGHTDGPSLLVRRGHLQAAASFSATERASTLVQQRCTACQPMVGADGVAPLSILSLPIDVEPWTAQSHPARVAIRQAVHEELLRRSVTEAWSCSPLCVTVVSLLPRAKRAVWTKDADNLVKGLLDACNGVLYADDRTIQCLTTRRVEYAGAVGCYFMGVRAVWPWGESVVHDDGVPPRIVSGTRIVT